MTLDCYWEKNINTGFYEIKKGEWKWERNENIILICNNEL